MTEIAPQSHPSSVTAQSIDLLHAIESPALPSQTPPDRLRHLEGTPVSAAPSASSMVRAASLPSLPPGGFPATNDNGERICRQCGERGRYKEGKCVEKWGPGPEGPGTVCDRCRKKKKRIERLGTLYPHSQTSASVDSRSHAPVQVRDYVHGAGAPQGTDRPIGRTDPLVVSRPPLSQFPRRFGGPSEARERDAVSPRGNTSSVTVAGPKGDATPSDPSSPSHSRSPFSFLAYPWDGDERLESLDGAGRGRGLKRRRTTSASSRESM